MNPKLLYILPTKQKNFIYTVMIWQEGDEKYDYKFDKGTFAFTLLYTRCSVFQIQVNLTLIILSYHIILGPSIPRILSWNKITKQIRIIE